MVSCRHSAAASRQRKPPPATGWSQNHGPQGQPLQPQGGGLGTGRSRQRTGLPLSSGCFSGLCGAANQRRIPESPVPQDLPGLHPSPVVQPTFLGTREELRVTPPSKNTRSTHLPAAGACRPQWRDTLGPLGGDSLRPWVPSWVTWVRDCSGTCDCACGKGQMDGISRGTAGAPLIGMIRSASICACPGH